jgi:hypothetical protein
VKVVAVIVAVAAVVLTVRAVLNQRQKQSQTVPRLRAEW